MTPDGRLLSFCSCFISYSAKDQSFAERLHADLRKDGVRCWFAPHDVQGGKKLHEQIDEAIQRSDRLLLILSEASMDSEWVKTEIAKARECETHEKRRLLFPVRLVDFAKLREWRCFDADTGKDSAREIREYYVPDFSNWRDHNAYQTEFIKLLRDLQTTALPIDQKRLGQVLINQLKDISNFGNTHPDEEVVPILALIDTGVDVNTKDDQGDTALHWTFWDRLTIVAQRLLDKGAAVNACNDRGETPLHAPAHHGHLAMVRLLMEHGADPNLADNEGRTPIDKAVANHKNDVVNFLMNVHIDGKA